MSVRQGRKRENKIVTSGDKGSIWMMFILIGVGYFLSFTIAATKIGRIYLWDLFFAAGVLLIIIGLIIRIKSISELKQYFTYTVTEIENHQLIETGLYKNIRHPGYFGQLLIFMGTAVAFSNWLSVVAMMIPVLSGYLYRIIVEERFMIKQMGQKYINYQKRTNKLIRGIY